MNQADPSGVCTGWGCVKYDDQFLQPIADAATLLACVLGFGVACFVTSLARIAISVLTTTVEYGAPITGGNLAGWCWKLW